MLSPQDRATVTNDAFDRNLKGMLGEAMAQSMHLKTQLDVANMELGVARDLIAAKDKELADKDAEIARLGRYEQAVAAEAAVAPRRRRGPPAFD